MINRRGQEEMVGFVLVVVIVAILFLVLLGIFVRQGPESYEEESREIGQFLDSAMEFTTGCALSYEPNYVNLGELIEVCHSGLQRCVSGSEACEVLEEDIGGMLEGSFNVVNGSVIKGYRFESAYQTNSSFEQIVNVSKGECGQIIRGGDYLAPAFPGNIVSTLDLCY